MISGARRARPSWLHRLVGRAMGEDLAAFVVPGPEVARAHGLNLEAAGLRIVGAPRHASVLLLVGELPEGLKKAAAVVYAQMMRPRAVFAVDAGEISPLPGPDVSADPNQDAVAFGVVRLRRAFAEGAFAPYAEGFEPEPARATESEEEGVNSRGGHGRSHEPGSAEEEEQADHREADEAADESDGGGEPAHRMQEPVPGEDFMSMVEMTKDLPVSGDGLRMEWVEAPYGPLFPGLPGGFTLKLTLDGDTVARAKAESEVGVRSLGGPPTPAGTFVNRLAHLDPLSPVAYRLLALRAIESAAGAGVDERTTLERVGALERERAAGHLGWLSGFGYLIGDGWLSRRAGELQLALLGAASAAEVEELRPAVERFLRAAERTLLLGRRLRGVGFLGTSEAGQARGPVARGRGFEADARVGEPVYRDLGFAPVVQEGGDALSRLRVRIEEVEQSLALVQAAGSIADHPVVGEVAPSGAGEATIETSRGAATLGVTLEGGAVVALKLDTPSTRHLRLAETVAEGRELGDALVGVASLDLSPWEVMR